MPIYEYQCSCGYRDDKFVWRLENKVLCPLCHKPMQRLFTGTSKELKSKRSKPRPYIYDPKEWSATKDAFETAKTDYEKGVTGKADYEYWKRAVEKENPTLIT